MIHLNSWIAIDALLQMLTIHRTCSLLHCIADVVETLDLSHNNFSGLIPPEIGDFSGSSISLRYNPAM